jgi:citrate synthase
MTTSAHGAVRLTSNEAAARLGVKKESLYAYVSRGLLASHLADDGRSSTFDSAEVEALRSRRRPRAGSLDEPILSTVTRVDDRRIFYRGVDALALARSGAGFESAATLLWTSALEPVAPFELPATIRHAIAGTRATLSPDAPLIDRLRAAVVVASSHDPLRHDLGSVSVVASAQAAITAMAVALPGRAGTVGASTARRLTARLVAPDAVSTWTPVVDAALVLLADHDLAASTFAARIAASTRADPYSVVLAGLGALGGPLHGAAGAPVHDLFVAARQTTAAHAVGAASRDDRRIGGFGHFLYPRGDPRAVVLLDLLRKAAGRSPQWRVVDEVRRLVSSRRSEEPNIDFALAATSFCADMPRQSGEAMFSIARTAGWVAHALDEYAEAPLRFRPVARYVGR